MKRLLVVLCGVFVIQGNVLLTDTSQAYAHEVKQSGIATTKPKQVVAQQKQVVAQQKCTGTQPKKCKAKENRKKKRPRENVRRKKRS